MLYKMLLTALLIGYSGSTIAASPWSDLCRRLLYGVSPTESGADLIRSFDANPHLHRLTDQERFGKQPVDTYIVNHEVVFGFPKHPLPFEIDHGTIQVSSFNYPDTYGLWLPSDAMARKVSLSFKFTSRASMEAASKYLLDQIGAVSANPGGEQIASVSTAQAHSSVYFKSKGAEAVQYIELIRTDPIPPMQEEDYTIIILFYGSKPS